MTSIIIFHGRARSSSNLPCLEALTFVSISFQLTRLKWMEWVDGRYFGRDPRKVGGGCLTISMLVEWFVGDERGGIHWIFDLVYLRRNRILAHFVKWSSIISFVVHSSSPSSSSSPFMYCTLYAGEPFKGSHSFNFLIGPFNVCPTSPPLSSITSRTSKSLSLVIQSSPANSLGRIKREIVIIL